MKWARMTQRQQSSASGAFGPKRAIAGPRNPPVCRKHGSPTCPPIVKILNGANPANLPFERPTKYELVINLKTAQSLNLDIPRDLLLVAEKPTTAGTAFPALSREPYDLPKRAKPQPSSSTS
jgi:hypothetical protein